MLRCILVGDFFHLFLQVVLKTCIVFHRLMRETDESCKFTKAMFGHITHFNKAQFTDDKSTDGFEMSEFIRSYCQYLEVLFLFKEAKIKLKNFKGKTAHDKAAEARV